MLFFHFRFGKLTVDLALLFVPRHVYFVLSAVDKFLLSCSFPT